LEYFFTFDAKKLGIIQKQTIKGTFYSYMGVLLGFVNTGLLLPNIISAAQNGLLGLINSYGGIFALFATLGFNSTIVRMFTYFRNEEKQHNGFFFILVMVSILGILLSSAVYFLLKPIIIDANIDKSPLFVDYYNYVYAYLILGLAFNFLDNYFTVLYNATLGMFLNEFVKRVFFSLAIFLFYFHFISFHTFIILYITAFAVPPLIMLFMLWKEGKLYLKPQFDFLNREIVKNLVNVSLFSLVSSFAAMVVMRTDIIMISAMVSLSATGIYTITYFFGTLIKVPARPLAKIASALYADAWKNNDLTFIKKIYKNSVINQSILGLLLFIGVWANIDNVFHILPQEYESGKWVIFYIGLASVIEMLSGANNVIISTSKHYRILTYFTFVLVFITVLTNYLLIPLYGITGAALASFISILVFNLLRYFFLWYKYKLQPFGFNLLIVFTISGVSYFLQTLIPAFSNFIWDIIIRSLFISVVFGVLILASKVSPIINQEVKKYFDWLKSKF